MSGPASAGPHRDLPAQIDFARGVAILMVLVYHGLAPWYANFGWQAVHVFVVVSGFVLTLAAARRGHDAAWGTWWRRRLRRLLPAYWTAVIAGFFLALIPWALPIGRAPAAPGELLWTALLDLALVQNFSYSQMLAYPNASLWFVPFIAGFYLVFVPLFRPVARGSVTTVTAILVAATLAEFAVRAAAIRYLDGMPVGFGQGVLQAFGSPPDPNDALDWSVPFQLWAPFGLFPTRVGEFVLGMAAARAYLANPSRVNRLAFGAPALLSGIALWAAGGALVHLGKAGWPYADWLIAAGLGLILPSVGALCARAVPRFTRLVELAGRMSLPLFLVHMPVLYVYVMLYPAWMHSMVLSVVMLHVAIACVLLATWGLARLDRLAALDRLFGLGSAPARDSA